MMTLLTQDIEVTRHSEGYYDENGRWVEGSTSTLTVKGRVQPYREGRVTKLLPEGISEEAALLVLSRERLYSANTKTKVSADTIEDDGDTYHVWSVKNFARASGDLALLNHYECVLLREDAT